MAKSRIMLQAKMRDRSALRLAESKHWYRRAFYKCPSCGSGDVMRAYDPSWTGWAEWCWCCGLKWSGEDCGRREAGGRVPFGERREKFGPLPPALARHRRECGLGAGACTPCRLIEGRANG